MDLLSYVKFSLEESFSSSVIGVMTCGPQMTCALAIIAIFFAIIIDFGLLRLPISCTKFCNYHNSMNFTFHLFIFLDAKSQNIEVNIESCVHSVFREILGKQRNQLFEATDFNGSSARQCGLCSRNCERQRCVRRNLSHLVYFLKPVYHCSFFKSLFLPVDWDSGWCGVPYFRCRPRVCVFSPT